MMNHLFRTTLAVTLLILFGTIDQLQAEPPSEQQPNWVQVTEDAGWQARDSQGELVYRDQLWIFGGWFNSYEAPPRDVWSSANGKDWKEVTPEAPWIHSDLSMTITFKDRMWLMGGWYNGRLEGHSAGNQVWSSQDGKNWTQVTKAAGWSPRLAAAIVEFQGKMWILGGSENYYFGDQSSLKNDVWCSEDGKNWEQITEAAPWAPRAYHQAVVLNDRIYLFGGGNYVPEYQAYNDVWMSENGKDWTRLPDAPWPSRLWFSATTYRDHMWVLGGWRKDPYTNLGDVWYSRDGKTWKQFQTKDCWKARHEHSVFVFQDKLWVAGGHAKPLNNEVWSLKIPEDYFKPQDQQQ